MYLLLFSKSKNVRYFNDTKVQNVFKSTNILEFFF